MSSKVASKKKQITLRTKLDIINELKEHPSRTEAAKKFGVSIPAISQIWKDRKTLSEQLINRNADTKKCRRVTFDKIDHALLQWFRAQRDRNVPLTGPLLLEKAKEFASALGISDFKASNGWLCKWKKRHNISFRVVCGESAAVDIENLTNWFDKEWKPICDQYKACDIYNADETGLFWRMVPNRTLAFAGERCSGGKQSKERLTVLLCCNRDGSDKLTPLVIGKSANPRAFSRLSNRNLLPVKYRNNAKAWMTSKLFEEWLRELDTKIRSERRNILLLLDNCTAHPTNLKLSNVKLLFLPPNTTSVSQPLDQGIIQNFKVHYRKRLLQQIIQKLDANLPMKIDVLEAIYDISSAWMKVTPTTIENCFTKAGFSSSGASVEIQEEEMVQPLIELYAERAGVSLEECSTGDQFSSFDNEVLTSTTPSDLDILASVTGESEQSVSSDDEPVVEDDDIEQPVSDGEAFVAIQTIKKWLLHGQIHDNSLSSVSKLEELCFARKFANLKQSTIDSYFSKKT